jgi:threonine dehydratase
MPATAAHPHPVLVTLAELRAAAAVLRGIAVRTPLLPADELAAEVGASALFLKPEMLQRGGAFKFRGAYYFLSRMSPEARRRGVIAPSSGNHAQAVAMAAKMFGVPATVVMPTNVTAAKRSGAERLGARVELAGTSTAHRMARALELVRD